jgi:hypothetical protein
VAVRGVVDLGRIGAALEDGDVKLARRWVLQKQTQCQNLLTQKFKKNAQHTISMGMLSLACTMRSFASSSGIVV